MENRTHSACQVQGENKPSEDNMRPQETCLTDPAEKRQPEKRDCTTEISKGPGKYEETPPAQNKPKETALIPEEQKETNENKETALDQNKPLETGHKQDKVRELSVGQEICRKTQTAQEETSLEKDPCKETALEQGIQKEFTGQSAGRGTDKETALKQENKKIASAEEKLKETSQETKSHKETDKCNATFQGQIEKESVEMKATTMEQKGDRTVKGTGRGKSQTTEDQETLRETSTGKETPKETCEQQCLGDQTIPSEPETAQGWLDLCLTEWALKARKIPTPETADWRDIYKKRPFGRNFLKSPNPEGLSTYQPPPQEQCDPPPQRRPLETLGNFSGWTISTEEIPVDRSNVPPGVVVCYLPMYSWCVKEQLVDLVSEGLWAELLDTYQPDIYVLDWYEDSKLHQQVYELHVRLLAADRTTVIAQCNLTPENDMCGDPGAWNPVSHIFKSYGSGVRYVHFLHKSKNLSVLGFHRTRIADSTLFVQVRDLDLPNETK